MRKFLINHADKILAITKDDDYLDNPNKQAKVKEYERQIDQLVYKLYGLTDDEIEIIEKSLPGKTAPDEENKPADSSESEDEI